MFKINCYKLISEKISLSNYNKKGFIKISKKDYDKDVFHDFKIFKEDELYLYIAKDIKYYYREKCEFKKTFILVNIDTLIIYSKFFQNFFIDNPNEKSLDLNFDFDIIDLYIKLCINRDFEQVRRYKKKHTEIYIDEYIFDNYFNDKIFIKNKEYYMTLNKIYEFADFLDSSICDLIEYEMNSIRNSYIKKKHLLHNGYIISYVHSLMELYPDLTEKQSNDIKKILFNF